MSKPKEYYKYLHKGTTGKTIEACGSDSIYYPDLRWSQTTADARATAHMNSLNKNLNKGYIGYNRYVNERLTSFRIIGDTNGINPA